jgi:hypothetical protein
MAINPRTERRPEMGVKEMPMRTEQDMKVEMENLGDLIAAKLKAVVDLREKCEAVRVELQRYTDEKRETEAVAQELVDLARSLRGGTALVTDHERGYDTRVTTFQYKISCHDTPGRRVECTLKVIT